MSRKAQVISAASWRSSSQDFLLRFNRALKREGARILKGASILRNGQCHNLKREKNERFEFLPLEGGNLWKCIWTCVLLGVWNWDSLAACWSVILSSSISGKTPLHSMYFSRAVKPFDLAEDFQKCQVTFKSFLLNWQQNRSKLLSRC